jgi:hypothetical protein
LSAAEATTSLSGVLNTLLSPSTEGAKALATLGMTAEGLRKQVAEEGLGAALTSLVGKLKGNEEATAAVFGNVRALAGVMGTSGVQAEVYAEKLGKIQGTVGSLGEAFKVWEGTTAGTWAKFTAGAQAAAVAVGDQLAPAFSRVLQAAMPLLDAVVAMVNWFSQLPQPVQTAAIGFAALLAAVGPVVYAIGSFMKAGAGLLGLLRMVPGAATAAGSGWALLSNPITLTIGAIGGVLYALKQLTGSWTGAFKILMPPIGFFLEAWEKAGDAIRRVKSLMPGGSGAPDAPGAPKAKLNAALGPALEINQAMSLLDQQLDSTTSKFEKFGSVGATAGKKVVNELLEATRLVNTEAAMRGPNAVGSDSGGLLAQLGMLPNMADEHNRGLSGRLSLQDELIKAGMGPGPSVGSRNITEQYRDDPPDPDGFGDAFSGIGKDLSSAIISAFSGGGDVAKTIGAVTGSALGEGLSNIFKGTDFFKGLGGMMGGIMGQVASMFGPVLSAIMGPLVDKIVDAIYKSDAERAQDEISNEWGINISDSTAQSIEETMKGQFEGMKNNRWAAEVMHLADIIDDAGGLAAENIGALEQQFRQAFVFLDEGTYSLQDTKKVLDENFAAFAAYYTDRNELVSANVQEMIKLDHQFGTESQAVAEFVEQQTNTAVTGLQTFLENAKITSQGVADSVGATIGGIFASLTQEGASPLEALTQLAPSIEAFNAQLAQTGMSGGAAFAQIQALSAIATSEITGPMVQAVSGLNDVFTGLHNAGILTQEMFGGLSLQVAETFANLQGQGVSAQNAMMLMQPSLQRIWELQKQFGYEVDASTQAMLDQAETAGIVGAKHQSVEQQTLDVLKSIATVLGAEIPAAMQTMADTGIATATAVKDGFAAIPPEMQAVIDSGGGIHSELLKLPDAAAYAANAISGMNFPDIQIGVRPNWKDWDMPEQPGGPTGGTGSKSPTSSGYRPMATGGIVTRPMHALIGEAGPEAVIPLDEWKDSGPSIRIDRVYGTVDKAFVESIAKTVQLGGKPATAWRGVR